MKYVDQQQLVEDAHGKRQPPDGRVRPQKGTVRHDGHAERDPEEEGGQEAPFSIVLCVLFWYFNECCVDKAGNEDEKDCDCVRSPKVRGFICVFDIFLLLLLETIINSSTYANKDLNLKI